MNDNVLFLKQLRILKSIIVLNVHQLFKQINSIVIKLNVYTISSSFSIIIN